VGLGLRVVRDPELAFDVDTVDDLARLPAQLTAPVPNA
jgi:CTP:molybdopterin cytidylyltransferase MocA